MVRHEASCAPRHERFVAQTTVRPTALVRGRDDAQGLLDSAVCEIFAVRLLATADQGATPAGVEVAGRPDIRELARERTDSRGAAALWPPGTRRGSGCTLERRPRAPIPLCGATRAYLPLARHKSGKRPSNPAAIDPADRFRSGSSRLISLELSRSPAQTPASRSRLAFRGVP
jgi:hypothetical protein